MRIKAFDLGTFMGASVVVGEPGGPAKLTHFELIRMWGKGKGEVKNWERWPVARNSLKMALLLLHDGVPAYDYVAFEVPMGSMKNKAATKVLVGLELALEEACGELGISLLGVSQTELKLWGTCTLPRGTCDHNVKAKPRACTGRGNAEKPEMVAAANRLWNINLSDDNVADACLLAGYAAEKNGLILPGCR